MPASTSRILSATALVAGGLILLGLCGCESKSPDPVAAPACQLTVSLLSPELTTLQNVEIPFRPNDPFSVRTNDERGDDFQITGFVREKPGLIFGLDNVHVAFQSADGADRFSGSGPSELRLGQDWSVWTIASIVRYGYALRVTRLGSPATPAASPRNVVTFFGIDGTNQIGGEAIAPGVPVYEKWGTNPPQPINQAIGPNNTYHDPVGCDIPVIRAEADNHAVAASLPTMPAPEKPITFTSAADIYIEGTNRGTISRTITLSRSPIDGRPILNIK